MICLVIYQVGVLVFCSDRGEDECRLLGLRWSLASATVYMGQVWPGSTCVMYESVPVVGFWLFDDEGGSKERKQEHRMLVYSPTCSLIEWPYIQILSTRIGHCRSSLLPRALTSTIDVFIAMTANPKEMCCVNMLGHSSTLAVHILDTVQCL